MLRYLALVCIPLAVLSATGNFSEQPKSLAGLSEVDHFDTNPGNLNFYQYIPNRTPRKKAALVVALHGCAGSATQFSAAGFNELAEKHRFYVIYPEQRAANNSDLCFNHQISGAAEKEVREVSSVLQMINYMRSRYSIANDKIFVTGFSSGGQLAIILAATYPQLFAAISAVGAGGYQCETEHSGIRDFAECFMGAELPAIKFGKKRSRWPRAAIWHAKYDKNVPYSRMQVAVEQWRAVHKITKRRPQKMKLPGNVSYEKYRDNQKRTVLETYTLNTMAHTVPVTHDCGKPGGYFTKEKICFARQSVRFFGINKPR